MAAVKYKLDKLVVILDKNRLQVCGMVDTVMSIEPVADKWRAFNWHVLEVDGHNIRQILKACKAAEMAKGRPTIIIADTVKGKGVSYMENAVEWHSKVPTAEQKAQAFAELTAAGM